MINMASKARGLGGAVVLGVAAQLILAGADPAQAQRRDVGVDVDEAGRAVAIRNIAGRETIASCVRGTGTGRVTELQRGRGGIIDGAWVQNERFGRGFINIGIDELRASASDKQRISQRLGEIMAPGNRVRVVSFGCGAAGRVEELDAVTLLSGPARSAEQAAPAPRPAAPALPPEAALRSAPGQNLSAASATNPAAAAPAPAPSPATVEPAPLRAASAGATRLVWREKSFQPGRSHALEIRSTRPRMALVIECTIATEPRAHVAGYLDVPQNFVVTDDNGQMLIDGVPSRATLGGADDTVVISDDDSGNVSAVSPGLRNRLLNAQTITITGRVLRGPRREDTVHLVPAPEKLARFEERCAALRPVRSRVR